MSDLGFKGTYAHSNDSPIESSVKSAGAPATIGASAVQTSKRYYEVVIGL